MKPIFRSLLLKLAARCNLNCTYCYWFRDKSVYEKPSILTLPAERALFERLEAHIIEHDIRHFSMILHGGEPLLFGKTRFLKFLAQVAIVRQRTGCNIRLGMTTNGALIDDEWARLFNMFHINVTVSIDGPAEIHDKARVDFAGRGTHNDVIRGLNILRHAGVEPGVLAVCDPSSDPELVTGYFVDVLGLKQFDILVPEATHEDAPESIAAYYNKLFDLWYDGYVHRGIDVRYPKAMLRSLQGQDPQLDAIGYGPIEIITMLTDGSLEPIDCLRIAGEGSTATSINIQTHTFQDVATDPVWREAYDASLNLCDTCKACEYDKICGGGRISQRWSTERRYDNPSVYCDDLKEMFGHIRKRVAGEIELVV